MKKTNNAEYRNEPHFDSFDSFTVNKYETHGYFSHFHTGLELYGVVDDEGGCVVCEIGTEKITLHSGQFVCIPPLTFHSYRAEGACQIILLNVGRKYLHDFWELYPDRSPAVFLFDAKYNARLTHHLKRTGKRSSKVTELERRGIVDLILNDVVSRYGFMQNERGGIMEIPSVNERATACAVVRYLYDNYAEKLTLKTLAQKFNMAEMVLSRLISKVFGIDLRILVSNVRIQMFYEMRRDERNKDVSNLALAYRCGFNNQRTFDNAYRRTFSPQE